ncbi:MAG: caspase family protein, partial [Planctomycetota bacterium]|nr:caspase family protein [Planctomycetota bacterium]
MNSISTRHAERWLAIRYLVVLGVLLSLAGLSALRAQDNTRAVGVRPNAVFEPLKSDASPGSAGMFVGVNEFTTDPGLSRLYYAVHDAIETAHLFAFELKLIPPQNCYLLLGGEPDPKAEIVRQHLEQLRKAGATISGAERSKILTTFLQAKTKGRLDSDLFVCSFSSHGFNQGSDAFVMPSDGSRQLLRDTAVPLATIEFHMGNPEDGSKAGHRVLLVDACQERIPARGGSTGAATEKSSAAFATELKKPTGQSKLASCGPNEFSFEADGLGGVGHGVFTYSFLEALRGGAAADAQQLVRLGAVSDFVAASVTKWTEDSGKPKQTPFLTAPVAARQLPLALRADDLTSLIATIRKQPTRGPFTAEFRTRLADALAKANPSQAKDREFVTIARNFNRGKFPSAAFIPYAKEEIDRLLLGTTPRPIPGPRPIPAPTPPVVPGTLKPGDERLDNALQMKLVWCPPGSFTMG